MQTSELLKMMSDMFLDPYIIDIILLSLGVSLVALLTSVIFSLITASILTIYNFFGKNTLTIIINSLMSIPPVAVGLFFYILLSQSGPLGHLNLLYSPTAMVLAQFVIVTPIIITLSKDTLDQTYDRLHDYLFILKSGFILKMKTILWESRYSLMINVLTGLSRALSEVGAVIIVGGNIDYMTRVMTTSIVLETSRGDIQRAVSLGIILILIALLINILLNLVKRLEIRAHG